MVSVVEDTPYINSGLNGLQTGFPRDTYAISILGPWN